MFENSNLYAGTAKNVWDGGISPDGVYFVKLNLISETGEVIETEYFVTVVR